MLFLTDKNYEPRSCYVLGVVGTLDKIETLLNDWFHDKDMIDTSIVMERLLQNYRFRKAKPHIVGDVLDFGGNEGELGNHVEGKYLVVNYDHSVMKDADVDTIVSLAVIEHIEFEEVFKIFHKFKNILRPDGRIVLTTPAKATKPILELMALLGILEKENIEEHKHYWTKKEIFQLADETGFVVKKFRRFDLNQLVVLEHK